MCLYTRLYAVHKCVHTYFVRHTHGTHTWNGLGERTANSCSCKHRNTRSSLAPHPVYIPPPPTDTHTTPTYPFRNGRSLTTALNTPTDSVYIFMRALKSGPTPTPPSSRAAAASSCMHASTSAQCSSPTTAPIVLKPWTWYCFMLHNVYQLLPTYRQTEKAYVHTYLHKYKHTY